MRILVTGGSGFIGTNFIELLLTLEDVEFINLDYKAPRNIEQQKYWRECDILDYARFEKITVGFAPTHIVHLAAKTGLDEKRLSAFAANIEGVKNLLSIIEKTPTVKRVIFTSTLLVCKMGYVPKHDTDYQPSTIYGQSKVEGEKIVRMNQNLAFEWTIIRPISIWGPWANEPYKGYFKSIAQGWYFHIGTGHYKRSLGYVGNIVHQIQQLLLADTEKIDKKTFYVADKDPADLYELSNEIQETFGAKKIRHLPLWLVKFSAKIGDICKILGWKSVPISSFRLNNILTEYIFDMEAILNIAAPLPFTRTEGVKKTVTWLRKMGEV